jgi:hypothetical protein
VPLGFSSFSSHWVEGFGVWKPRSKAAATVHCLIGQNHVRGIIRTLIRETRSGMAIKITGEYELQPDNMGIYSNRGALRGDLDHERRPLSIQVRLQTRSYVRKGYPLKLFCSIYSKSRHCFIKVWVQSCKHGERLSQVYILHMDC